MSMDWCEAGAATLDPESKTLFVQCKGAAVGDEGSAPDYGQAPMMCALGLFVIPYQATSDGAAELLVERDIAGLNGAIVAARDARMSDVVGNGKPGDAILSTVGPQHKACIHLKEEKRQVAILSEDSKKRTQLILIDGANDKLQISVSGAVIQVDPEGLINMTGAGGGSITVGGGNVHLVGNIIFNQPTPGFALMKGPQAGSLGGASASPMFAVQNVFARIALAFRVLFGRPLVAA